jgi:hypothetical protein
MYRIRFHVKARSYSKKNSVSPPPFAATRKKREFKSMAMATETRRPMGNGAHSMMFQVFSGEILSCRESRFLDVTVQKRNFHLSGSPAGQVSLATRCPRPWALPSPERRLEHFRCCGKICVLIGASIRFHVNATRADTVTSMRRP